MIKEVRIKTVEELMPLLAGDEYAPELKRYRSSFVYRGVSDSSFRMFTSLRRNCRELSRELEPSILKNYTKYAVLEEPGIEGSVWMQMISGSITGFPRGCSTGRTPRSSRCTSRPRRRTWARWTSTTAWSGR